MDKFASIDNTFFCSVCSYIKHSQCLNKECVNSFIENDNEIILINAFDGIISPQKKHVFLSPTTTPCNILNCGDIRKGNFNHSELFLSWQN